MSIINNMTSINTKPFVKKAITKAGEIAEKQWHHAVIQGALWTAVEVKAPVHDLQSLLLSKLFIDLAEIAEHIVFKGFGSTKGLLKDSKITGKQQGTNVLSWIIDGASAIKKSVKTANIKSKIEARIKSRKVKYG